MITRKSLADSENYRPAWGRPLDWVRREIGWHSIYVIGPSEEGPVKVGIAADPWVRYRTIQSSNWIGLHRYHEVWLSGDVLTKRIEATVHADFEPHRVRGEWFERSAKEAIEQIEARIKEYGYNSQTPEQFRDFLNEMRFVVDYEAEVLTRMGGALHKSK